MSRKSNELWVKAAIGPGQLQPNRSAARLMRSIGTLSNSSQIHFSQVFCVSPQADGSAGGRSVCGQRIYGGIDLWMGRTARRSAMLNATKERSVAWLWGLWFVNRRTEYGAGASGATIRRDARNRTGPCLGWHLSRRFF
ncbi:hypothetical protein MAPG_02494 [Magnaporthiopsis poae ATCC 64411]|uniref:Uncharacterized protein n=1 Tax=Magnaporthiopsis poae (strain ATCC 64411 / 73-15) TaxID=644358 RepID=A0A0C4DRI5_MAGP6|nr:hypothetical protein MAPG_02494 [Magnaporthiopsis poae ATCC 64411]